MTPKGQELTPIRLKPSISKTAGDDFSNLLLLRGSTVGYPSNAWILVVFVFEVTNQVIIVFIFSGSRNNFQVVLSIFSRPY